MEIAFTTLFGGFDQRFYEAYQRAWPMPAGYMDRFEIYNLYPLLVHANLFGGHYMNQVRSILAKYG
jgi:fructosamine-3-kinase